MNRATLCLIAALAMASAAEARAETLTISVDTTPAGGNYAPRNIVAVWVEAADGRFIKTLGRWSDRRTQHLVAWVAASGMDTDAVSGATRSNHNDTLQMTWDLTDRAGQPIADGDYVVRMELADRNSTTPDQNNEGSFAVTIDGSEFVATDAGGGFENVSIEYTAGGAPPPDPDPPPGEPDAGPDDTETIGNIEGGCQSSGGGAGFLWVFVLFLLTWSIGSSNLPACSRRSKGNQALRSSARTRSAR